MIFKTEGYTSTFHHRPAGSLLIYLLWQLEVQTNQEIGELFGLTPSAVSRRVALFKEAVEKTMFCDVTLID